MDRGVDVGIIWGFRFDLKVDLNTVSGVALVWLSISLRLRLTNFLYFGTTTRMVATIHMITTSTMPTMALVGS